MKTKLISLLTAGLICGASTFAANNDHDGYYLGKEGLVGGSSVYVLWGLVNNGRLCLVDDAAYVLASPAFSRVKKNGKFRGQELRPNPESKVVGRIKNKKRLVGTLAFDGDTYRLTARKKN